MRGRPARRTLVALALALALGVSMGLAAGHGGGRHARHGKGHEGCGQHHPLVVTQQRMLRRRLEQLRTTSVSNSEPKHGPPPPQQQQQQQQLSAKQQQQQQQQPSTKQQDPKQPQQQPRQQPSASGADSQGKAAPAELRIEPVFELGGLPSADAARVRQQLVPAALKVVQRYVKVIRPPGGVLKLDAFFGDGQQGCLTSRINASLAAGGLAGHDLLLFVTADSGSCLPGMIAVATSCDVDPATGRPILGALNVCASSLAGLGALTPGSDAEAAAVGRLVEVLVHEIVHVLGFGSTHYGDWRGADGRRYGEQNVVRTVGGRPYLVTPRVAAVAREHFGCSSLPGAPLENEGPSFSATSHFEYRLLQREMMGPARPIDRSRTRLSVFTLAALEDTGWYAVDYGAAEPIDWGRGAGCSFVTDSCWDYMARQPAQPYFCGSGSVNQTRCTAEAQGWGVCRTSAFSDGCLLVGKYSTTTSAVQAAQGAGAGGTLAGPSAGSDGGSSSDDGRQAACYSPPQLAGTGWRGAGGGEGPLLPLLGGSYGAQRGDICYNLVRPAGEGGGEGGGGGGQGASRPQLPEDVARAASAGGGPPRPAKEQAGRPADAARASGAAAALGRHSAARFTYMDELPGGEGAPAAACVNLGATQGGGGASSSDGPGGGSGGGSQVATSMGRRLLALLSGRRLAAAGARQRLTGPAGASSASERSGLGSSARAAACISSPVLCFRSSCDSEGKLWVTAAPAGSGGGATAAAAAPPPQGSTFACPSGSAVDLSRQLPGRYTLGFLQCPSNALVCETTGCGDCSAAGGYCSRGKCHCHMERFGAGCRETLVPRMG